MTIRFINKWWAPITFSFIAIFVTIYPSYKNTPPIRSDGLGYHIWTRAILDRNLSFCEYAHLDNSQAISAPQELTGRCINKYPPGLAILRFPVMAFFTSSNHDQLRSSSEDTVNQIFSLTFGLLAVLLMVKTALLAGVKTRIANLSAISLAFGTGLFHFTTYDSSFTHIYSTAIIAFASLLAVKYSQAKYSTERGIHETTLKYSIGLAGCSFMLISIRNPLALVVGGALLWVVFCQYKRGFKAIWQDHYQLFLLVVSACALALSLQLLYNHYIFGSWVISSYAGEQFHLLELRQISVMLSVEKGLFVWYPIMGLTLLCTSIWARRYLFLCLFTTVPLILLYGSWHAWGLGGGFGHRGFTELAPIYCLALSMSISKVTKIWVRRTLLVALFVCVYSTIGLMRGYWDGSIGFSGTKEIDVLLNYSLGSESYIPHILRSDIL